MEKNLFGRYADVIRNANFTNIAGASDIPNEFMLDQGCAFKVHYIPFDVVNPNAKLVLVGITPGFTQWKNAMVEAQRQLQAGASDAATRFAAKRTGAFSGAMRPNLISLLDNVGLQHWLKIDSCEQLFGADADLVQTTSILRHPIFVNGENYSGAPNMIRTPFLQAQMLDHFALEAAQLPAAVYVPMGPKVSEGLSWLAQRGVLDEERILHGLPHPSGANAERIAYFLGRKQRSALSAKTNPDQLDATRKALLAQVERLM